jgi:hypothetical protein
MIWEKTILTGDRDNDAKALEQTRAEARSQGLVTEAMPLLTGGWHVRALSRRARTPR